MYLACWVLTTTTDYHWSELTDYYWLAVHQRWRWPLATSPNAKIFAMWRKICDVFSHSGENENEIILSRFRGKSRLKNDCITIVFYINMALFHF